MNSNVVVQCIDVYSAQSQWIDLLSGCALCLDRTHDVVAFFLVTCTHLRLTNKVRRRYCESFCMLHSVVNQNMLRVNITYVNLGSLTTIFCFS